MAYWWFTGAAKKNTKAIDSLEVRLAALEQSQVQLQKSIEEIKSLVSDTAVMIAEDDKLKEPDES